MRTEDLVAGPSNANVSESEDVAITATETLVVSCEGGVSCDVWLRVPVAWLPSSEVVLYGIVGSARSEIARVTISDVTGTTASGYFHGTCLMVRGRPCDGFEATLRWTGPGGAPSGTGRLILQVFETDTPAIAEKRRPPRGDTDSPLVLRGFRSVPAEVSITPTTTETVVQTLAGGSACDVWVRVPDAWRSRLEVTLYGLLAGNRVELLRKNLTDAPGKTVSTVFTGQAISLRSRPCDSFEVAIKDLGGAGSLTGSGFVTGHVFEATAPPLAQQTPAPDGSTAAPLFQRTSAPPKVDSSAIALPATATVVATATGGTDCDVWVAVPTAWQTRTSVNLYGRLGTARLQLGSVKLSDVPGTSDGTTFSAVALSSRGRRCESFEVEINDTTGVGLASTGRVFLQPSEAGARPLVQSVEPPTGATGNPFFHRALAPAAVVSSAFTISTTETTVATSGPGTNCDVWIKVPDAWKTRMEVALWGNHGAARVELLRTTIANAPGTSSGGNFSAIVAAARGRYSETFEVTVKDVMGAGATGTGTVRLQPVDTGVAPVVQQQHLERGTATTPMRQQVQALTSTDSGALTNATTTEATVATATGATDCDVWVRVPDAWKPDLQVVLYGTIGLAKVEIARVMIADCPGTSTGGNFSAIAISSRGRRCDTFEVAWRSMSGSTLTGTGRVYIQPADIGGAAAAYQLESLAPAALSATFSLTGTETVVATCGAANGCDVWVKAPNTWRTSTTVVRLYGRLGPVRVLLASGTLDTGPQTVGSDTQILPLTYRGRPCGSFELSIQWTHPSAGAPSGTARAVLQPILDGSAPRAEQVAAPEGTTTAPLFQRAIQDPREYYAAVAYNDITATAVNIGYIFNDGSKIVAITRIRVNARVASNGAYILELARMTAEPTTAGTAISEFRSGETNADNIVKRGGTPVISASLGELFTVEVGANDLLQYVWEPPPNLGPIILPLSVARGLRLSATPKGTPTGTTRFYVTFEWYEP